jgi:acetyl-CoA C-acetyltransferase
MRQVSIIGIGQTSVDEHWDKSLRELAGEASFSALTDAGRSSVDGLFIGNMLSGMLSKQENIGALISDWIGLHGVEAYKIETACSSGASALRAAIMAVGSGQMDSALVIGVEKMTESLPIETTEALATAADADYESAHGLSFVAINALVMQRYLQIYNWKHTDFGTFSINAHANAMYNPNARLHDPITTDDYNRARMIAAPINLLDASPIGDGAAALVLVPTEYLRRYNRSSINIIGSASSIDTIAVHSRKDPLWLTAAETSAKKAYAQAGLKPENIDLFELHDAFSIMSALSLEACGFVERGQAPRLAIEEQILPSGKIPITTRGGLKARGHPVGATGVYQIVEVVQQLRGECGATQVAGAKIGMAQNIGGSGATIITTLLECIN